MKKQIVRFASAVALVAMSAALVQAGGWSIITLREFPESTVVAKPLMLVDEHRNVGARELFDNRGLRPVHDHEIRLEIQNALDVRIDQAAHAGDTLNLRWESVVASDTHDSFAGPHGIQHLRRRRDDRDDALWLRRCRARIGFDGRRPAGDRAQQGEESRIHVRGFRL